MKSKFLKKMLSLAMAVLVVIPMLSYSASGLMANAAEQTNYVPVAEGKMLSECFPDPIFARYVYEEVLKHGDVTQNDYVLTQADVNEIKTTEAIYIDSNDSLNNLTGVQNFESLKSLYCRQTNLTNLDVSHNTKLIYLACSETGLTNLDLSQNTELKTVDCSNTKITSLDLSKNTEIRNIYCFKTNITSLDLSKSKKLWYINCSNTGITSLDVSQNTNLWALNCSHTGITSLDISKNLNLWRIDCSSTGLTSLDISNNINLGKLSDIKCIDTGIVVSDLYKVMRWPISVNED